MLEKEFETCVDARSIPLAGVGTILRLRTPAADLTLADINDGT
jgi:hypothetical protein